MKPRESSLVTRYSSLERETRTLRNYIGGEWREASTADTLPDINPATGEVAALVPLSGTADVDAAVRAAREAQPAWRAVPPQRRARAIMALREELWRRREDLARLVTDDMGKTLDDARGEVLRGIESTEAATAIPHLLKGENLEGVAQGVDVEQVRQPVGVVGAITPFNFPTMIPLWFLPFALACGNGFVLKMDPTAHTTLALTYLGSTLCLYPTDIAVDASGGKMPMLISGWAKRAFGVAITRSPKAASSAPPPIAGPFTTQMTGLPTSNIPANAA